MRLMADSMSTIPREEERARKASGGYTHRGGWVGKYRATAPTVNRRVASAYLITMYGEYRSRRPTPSEMRPPPANISEFEAHDRRRPGESCTCGAASGSHVRGAPNAGGVKRQRALFRAMGLSKVGQRPPILSALHLEDKECDVSA